MKKISKQEKEIDAVIKVFRSEKKIGKLKTVRNLKELMRSKSRTLRKIRQSQKEFVEGKGKILRSLADLH